MLSQILATAHFTNTGRERIGMWLGERHELDVVDRRDNLRRLDALLGRAELLRQIPLTDPIRADLVLLDFELRPLPRDFRRALDRFTRSSTSTTMLRSAFERRRHRSAALARLHDRDPARAYDASHNDLLPLLSAQSAPARAHILIDALLQFRALRRSPDLVDRKPDGGRDDNSQGRLTTSGLLASLEQALLCQSARDDRAERALLRLAVVNAPHAAPSTIYEASNVTLELLHGGLLGRAFEPVYAAVHTLYSADTAPLVRRFFREHIAPGLADEHAFAIVAHCVDVAAGGAAPARSLAIWRERAGVDVRDALAFLRERVRPAKLQRASPAAFLDTMRAILRLHSCVCVGAPTARSLARDAGFGAAAARDVRSLVRALDDGADLARVLDSAASARVALGHAFNAVDSGDRRARLWKLDRDVEHVAAVALGDAVRALRTRRERRLLDAAIGCAWMNVHASGLDAVAGADDADDIARALARRFTERARAVHFAGIKVLLDPRFVDRFIKESALHALLELASLSSTSAATHVRVIVKPAVPILDRKDIRPLSPSALRAAQLPAHARAVLVDERAAPPGYSHLSVLARDRGVGIFAVRDVRQTLRSLPKRMELVDGALRSTNKPKPPPPRPQFTLAPPRLDDDIGLLTLQQLAQLPLQLRREIAGEKAAVLAELRARWPRLALDGVVIPFGTVARAVREAGLFDAWMRGSGAGTRNIKRQLLRRLPSTSLAALDLRGELIVRCSGSAEDRPGKSDAGLSTSIAGVDGRGRLLSAVVRVIASMWNDELVRHNRALGVSMRQVWPALVVQRDLSRQARVSGVAVSRGRDGAFGAISYQAVAGAGGGVRRARGVEEGTVSPVEHVGGAVLSTRRARRLGPAVLDVERLFHDVVEPGAGHAVEVEWLFTGGGALRIVQARAISEAR